MLAINIHIDDSVILSFCVVFISIRFDTSFHAQTNNKSIFKYTS
ncbi:hypothetical protein D083_3314 [Dickeya solani RNS 08.23.3.1.A]|nr:hypothetical protein D083_3314 [Dickeya solani RNS 08.23.3.1.A]